MDYILIALFVFIIITLIVYKITKAVIKTGLLALSILVIAMVITGILIVQDIGDIRNNFAQKPNIYLLNNKGVVPTGIIANPGQSLPGIISNSQISDIQQEYASNNYSGILDDNFKLFIVNLSVFNDTVIQANDSQLTNAEVQNLIFSSAPIDDYLVLKSQSATAEQKTILRQQLLASAPFKDDAEFRSFLFGLMLASLVQEKGAAYLFEKYQSGDMSIYPESITFTAMHYIPSSILANFIVGETNGTTG